MRSSEAHFTDRQKQVVRLIAAGCTNAEIGEYLGVSPRTAKAHCDVLRQMLGVRSRRQIPVAYCMLTSDDPFPVARGGERLSTERVAPTPS